MGLPSYIINFDELSDLLRDYLSSGVDVDIGGITFSTAELERLLGDIGSKIQGIDYNDLITSLNALGVKLDDFNSNSGISGTQKIYGSMLEITSIEGPQTISINAPTSGRITGITYSLSAWNYEDNWNLIVGETELFTTIGTKEYGEHKFFNVYYPITAGQSIQFIYNNNSGSSKILWVDFNILED
jgi:hypothetical protein